MHELGIVVHVVKQVEELVKKNNATKALEVTLEVGEVSGVVKEYFVDAFNWAAKRSEYMKECKLNYITIQAITYCQDCKHTYQTVKYGKECPYCHSPNTYLTTGKDVMIKDIKVI
ncbi:MAG: hydrogenase maturation nickel metallochaperone HypA [Erysipelotrichaceae bacterium]|nr:hydrogenase maturation nickel metallochaperone HypA [Erysipelotrichaceae bacterium]